MPVLASTLNQLFPMLFKDGFENPASDAERCLQLRYGLCGNHAALAQGLLEEAGMVAVGALHDPVAEGSLAGGLARRV